MHYPIRTILTATVISASLLLAANPAFATTWQNTSWIQSGNVISAQKFSDTFNYLYERRNLNQNFTNPPPCFGGRKALQWTGNAWNCYEVPLPVQHGTVTFNYTGGRQQWIVPRGITSINVDARGAQGGGMASSVWGWGVASGAPAGKGGRIQVSVPVTPGEILYMHVGESGLALQRATYGGGGAGFVPGGGASDVRRGGSSLANRVVVAGGGGGGSSSVYYGTIKGGDGGGATAGPAGSYRPVRRWSSDGYADGGRGGSQASGGSGGIGLACWATANGQNGTFGQGGHGGLYWTMPIAGSGGGGGYYGGGGGGGYPCIWGIDGGGGGGSSYPVNAMHTKGYQSGDGKIIITY